MKLSVLVCPLCRSRGVVKLMFRLQCCFLFIAHFGSRKLLPTLCIPFRNRVDYFFRSAFHFSTSFCMLDHSTSFFNLSSMFFYNHRSVVSKQLRSSFFFTFPWPPESQSFCGNLEKCPFSSLLRIIAFYVEIVVM